MDKLLQNQVAVITGSGSGVGRAAAVMFARPGDRFVCADIQEAWAKETVSVVGAAGGKAIAALFLAPYLASNITGVNLPVDGRLSAGRVTTGA
jgi:hypothetical protein